MTISQAYMQAKGISANTPVIFDNVYFENGIFNPNLAYENTSMATKRTLTSDDFNNFNNGGGTYLYDIIKDDIGDGRIIQCLGPNSPNYTLENGKIVYQVTPPSVIDEETYYSQYYGLILLPIRLPAGKYWRMWGRFLKSHKLWIGYAIYFYQSYIQTQYNKLSTGAAVYDYGDTVDVAFNLPTVSYDNWRDDMIYVGISTGGHERTEIHKIWFE